MNRPFSPIPLGQELNRMVALLEASHSLYVSATYLATVGGTEFPAGSRDMTRALDPFNLLLSQSPAGSLMGLRPLSKLRLYVGHIGWLHQLCCGFQPRLEPDHKLVLDGMQRLSPPARQRPVVSYEMVELICINVDLSIAHQRLICGAAVLDFFFCLRSSEYLTSSGRMYNYCLRQNDILVVDAHNTPTLRYELGSDVIITFRASKNDQTRFRNNKAARQGT